MLKITTKALAVLFFTTAAKCFALPFIEADAFASGDKKAMLDTTTGIEWLDFGVNNAASFNEVLNGLSTTYQGWRLPTEAEVRVLWNQLFAINEDRYDVFNVWGANKVPVEDNLPYLCWGYFLDNAGFLEYGYLMETGSQFAGYGASRYYLDGVVQGQVSTGSGIQYDSTNTDPFAPYNMGGTAEISTLLVRDTTINAPEPSSLVLFGLGFAGLLVGRRRLFN